MIANLRPRPQTRYGAARVLAVALVVACGGGAREDREPAPADAAPAAPSPADSAAERPSVDGDTPATDSAGGAPGDTAEASAGAQDLWVDPPVTASRDVAGATTLLDVRTALHDGYDRVVFDFGANPLPAYRIAYLDGPATHCGSGERVPLDGAAALEIGFQPAHAHTEAGEATVQSRDRAPGLPAIRRLLLTCDFEAHVDWVASIEGRRQVRVLELRAPNRLVVDVRHRQP